MEVLEEANGPCVICGKESEGSKYWLPLPQAQWEVMRPLIEAQTPISPYSGVKLVMNMYFFPGLSKPLCGPECSLKHYEAVAADNCKRGG